MAATVGSRVKLIIAFPKIHFGCLLLSLVNSVWRNSSVVERERRMKKFQHQESFTAVHGYYDTAKRKTFTRDGSSQCMFEKLSTIPW